MSKIYRALGVISGTSMDGIDVAWIETDGRMQVHPGAGATYPYPDHVRTALLGLVADPVRAESADVPALEAAVMRAHGDAIERFLREHNRPQALDLIGLHGQTVFHAPQRRLTRQLGSGAKIAARFGVPTVFRFRHADVAAGGEGAPLVPLYHQALAAKLQKPLMILNLGGVGNMTYLGERDEVIAFDTGPASAMLDDFVRRRRGVPFDAGGKIAASGRADQALVAQFMRNPYFERPAPKSLDRNAFHADAVAVEELSDADGAATLAEFTVQATVAALRHVPHAPLRWLVTGGGRHNTFFMRRFAEELRVPVEPVEAVGWNGDFLEAQCFGYLAVRSLLRLPISLPSTTGVPQPMTGGEIAEP